MLRSSHDACGCSTQTTSTINLKPAPFTPTKGKPTGRIPHLTLLILVRIQVPQPYNIWILLRFVSFRLRRNSSDMSAGYSPSFSQDADGARHHKRSDGVFREGVCVLTIETIKTQLEAAETAAAADRRTLSSLVTKILSDWLKANSL